MALLTQNMEAGGLVREVHQVSLNPGSITTGALGTATATITGLTTADEVIGWNCPSVLEAGLHFKGADCTANTLTVTLENVTGGSIDGGAETWNFEILRTTATQA
jgi:hypothetical protein